MLRVNHNNPQANNSRFCVALELNKGWVDKLLIANLDSPNVEVVVNYDHHMMRYQLCMSLNHKIKDYPNLVKHCIYARSSIIFKSGEIMLPTTYLNLKINN